MRIYFTILEKEKNTDMLSELKLTILENNKLDFVKAKLSDTDKLRIQGWFTQQIGLDKMHKDFDDILDIFLWCCTEGEYAADTQNPQIFARVFGKKASESEISVSDLSSLFFSHSSLFESISDRNHKASTQIDIQTGIQEEFTFGVDSKNITDFLAQVDSAEFTMALNEQNSPLTLIDNNFSTIIMPIIL